MVDFLKRNRFNLTIIGLAFLCWGRLLVLRGIWSDDWAWVWHYFGSKNLSEFLYPYFSMTRPLDGLFAFSNFKLFEIIPQAATNIYNIERFFIFLINAFLLYRIAKLVLHKESLLPEIIGIVYLVSPLVHNICFSEIIRRLYLCFFLVSIIFSIKSINGRTDIKKPNYLIAILFSSLAMLNYESFVSFDLLRPLIIFYILTEKFKEKTPIAIKKAFFHWLPFLIIAIAIVLYKSGLIIPRFGSYAHAFDSYHLPAYRQIAFAIHCFAYSLYYLFMGHLLHYIKIFLSFNYEVIVVVLSFLTALFAFFFVSRHHRLKKGPYPDILLKETRLIVFIGMLLIFLGIGPYSFFNRYLSFGTSRHALLASIGFAIFLSSGLLWLYYKGLLKKKQFCVLLAAIVFIWTFGCNDAIRAYNNDWQQQRSFWWQFIWRAPAIKDKTFLIVDMPREEIPYFGSDWCGLYEFGGPLNLLYAKSREKGEVYNSNHFAESLGRAILESEQYYLKNWNKEEVLFNSYLVPLKYYPRNLLLASYHNGYLYLNNDVSKENSSRRVSIEPLVANSSEDQIIYTDSELNYPLRNIIGPEPKKIEKGLRYVIRDKIFGKNVYKDWRYYFQRIKALEHVQDYKGIVKLYNEAERLGWSPQLPQSVPICVVKSLYLTGDIEKGNFLLWKWALSREGDFKEAINMLKSIKSINSSSNLHRTIEKEINNIWKGSGYPRRK